MQGGRRVLGDVGAQCAQVQRLGNVGRVGFGGGARRFGDFSDAFASGWMQLRGARRRQGVDRGFVLSDHADWPGLQAAIRATGAERIIVTHGYEAVMVRWLREQGLQAGSFRTEFGDEAAASDQSTSSM